MALRKVDESGIVNREGLTVTQETMKNLKNFAENVLSKKETKKESKIILGLNALKQ